MHLNLHDLPLEEVVAHGGDGRISFHRALDGAQLESPCNFVDYAVLAPGTSIGLHTHDGSEEVYLVLEGDGIMHLDGDEFAVTAGSVILNRPGGTHGLRNAGEGPLRLFVFEVAAAAPPRSAS